MSLNAELKWNNKMSFTAISDQHKIELDALPDHGGENKGPTPKQLVLHAMMACSAMDVVSMLEKMRQDISAFDMKIEADKNTHYPIYFKNARLKYLLEGNILPEKLIKAVDSSLTKYCGVNYMISKSTNISFEVYLNKTKIHEGDVHFIEPLPD